MSDRKKDFLLWEQLSRDTIDVKKVYIDVAGDLVSGILLSQIIFWFLPDKEGKTKLRVVKDGELWLAKGRDEWWDECRISAKQFDRAIGVLQSKEIVHKEIFKFNGNPTTHIRLNIERVMDEIHKTYDGTDQGGDRGKTILPFGEERSLPLGKNDIDLSGRSLTEITTEITTETTTTKEVLVEKKEMPVVEKEPEIKTSKPSELTPELVEKIKDVTKAEFINPVPFEALIAQPFGELRLKRAIDNFKALAANQNLDNPIGFLLYIAKNNITPSKTQSNTKKRFNDFEHHSYTTEDLNRLFEPVT